MADPALPPIQRGAARFIHGERCFTSTTDCDDYLQMQQRRLPAGSNAVLFAFSLAYDKTVEGGCEFFPVYMLCEHLSLDDKRKRVRRRLSPRRARAPTLHSRTGARDPRCHLPHPQATQDGEVRAPPPHARAPRPPCTRSAALASPAAAAHLPAGATRRRTSAAGGSSTARA